MIIKGGTVATPVPYKQYVDDRVLIASDPNNDGNIVLGYGGNVEGGGGSIPGSGLTAAEVQAMIDAALSNISGGTNDYTELTNKPTIPPSVSAIAHQYAVSNSKDNISDVETWTQVASSLSQRERSCIYANGYYVVCGVGGEVGYSKDGVTWTKITPFVSGTLTNITYGKGKFIIVDEFANLWMAEETPETWTKIFNGEDWGTGIGSITYANGQFVIAGDYMCAFSEDAISWTMAEAHGEYNQIAFGNGRYVAIGAGGVVSVSYDGKKWYDRSNPDVTGDLRAITYANGKYIIGGIDGLIMYTEDFVTWGIATSNSTVRYVRQIVYAENRYYAACYTSSGKGEIWISEDGETWTVQQQMNYRLWCLNYNDGKLTTAGDSGAVFILDLGIVWQTKQAVLANGQYLWERIVLTLSDGGKVIGNSVCIGGSGGSGGGNTGGGLTAEQVQAMIDAALAAIPNAEEASF